MRRLYTRIYLYFLGLLLVVGLVTPLVIASGARGELARAWTARLTRHVAWLLGHDFADPARRDETVRHIADELQVDVTVRRPDGGLVARAGEELAPLSSSQAARAASDVIVIGEGRGFWVAAPIHEPRTHRLLALLELRPAVRFGVGGLWRSAALVALILLVVGIGIGPLARRISRPVERLTEASRRLGGGDLSYRVPQRPQRRRDELDELTRAWNEMAERVEKLVRSERELFANISHELRSPLQRMRVALALLPESDQARVRDLELDLSELERLIDDVLTTSRLEATGLPAHLDEVSVDALLAQLAERALHDPATQGKEVQIAPGPTGLTLQADQALLKRALWNLVENAAKYGAPPITLSTERRGERLALRVTDEGRGIPPADRARVLDPFVRLDRARTPGAQGVGLGLTLARRVAEVHGGTIALDALHEDGHGLKVTLELPLKAG